MDGGAGASAVPVYNKFMDISKQAKPNFVSLVMPARWYTGGRGLDSFRKIMIEDKRLEILNDYVDAQCVFNNVQIKGGVCYFLWNAKWNKECRITTHTPDLETPLLSVRYLQDDKDSIFVRDPRILEIKKSISRWRTKYKEATFDTIVSSMKPYGLRGDFFKNPSKYNLPPISQEPLRNGFTIVGLGDNMRRTLRYVPNNYPLPNAEGLNSFKIFIPRNWGTGKLEDSTYNTYLANPHELCTETFVQVCPFVTVEERDNCNRYMQTKFFRITVSIKKQDQGAGKEVYSYVPLQDFTSKSDIDWTLSIADIDQQLYTKYHLSKELVHFIDTMIKPME